MDFGLEMRRTKCSWVATTCAPKSFPNWGHMRKSDTRNQSYGQNTATHSEIAPNRLDHDFLLILR
jgi:hypothetical protein